MDCSHILSGRLQVILLSFRFIWRCIDFGIKFSVQKRHKFFYVINVCCCCCLILLFVLTRFLYIGIYHKSNASFFTPLSYLLGRLSIRSYTNFFEKYLNYWGFLSVPHLVDNFSKIVDERGRNLMCNRVLPSLLVYYVMTRALILGMQNVLWGGGRKRKRSL